MVAGVLADLIFQEVIIGSICPVLSCPVLSLENLFVTYIHTSGLKCEFGIVNRLTLFAK